MSAIEAPNPDATDFDMRGWALVWRRPSKENSAAARDFFEQALQIDPNDRDALVGAAYTDVRDFAYGWVDPQSNPLQKASERLARALDIDPGYAFAYYVCKRLPVIPIETGARAGPPSGRGGGDRTRNR